jgi:inner membrane protein
VTDELYLLPDELTIEGELLTEERRRGIYAVPVYTARLRITGSLPVVELAGAYDDLEILWSQVEIALPLTDARPVQEPVVLASGTGTTQFRSGGERVQGFGPQLVASYADLGLGPLTAPQPFAFDLLIGGTGGLDFLPLGDETRVELTANWPSPSFAGAYLPDERVVESTGFSAAWRMLDLGRGFPSSWHRSDSAPAPEAAAFGAELITPVGVHEATLRAAKYGVLVLGLTFLAFFLFELFAGLRLHAIQYLLVGLVNTVFYVLLLALAEHLGFAVAYVASAVAAMSLITSYSMAVLGSLRRALPLGALLGGLYAYLYIALLAEDYALLIGSVGSFVVLGVFMHLTRRIDWFAVSFNGGGERTASSLPA